MSREEVSPEEMMSVAKSMAKGEGVQGSDSGNETSYQNGSQEGGYDSSSGQQTGYEDAPTGFSNLANQQGNFDNSGQTGGYEHVTEQQAYADAPSQQQGYSADPGSMSNAETSGQGGNNYGSNSGNSSAPAGNTGRTGLQARGEGFGEGFDQGFGQGLSGGPDGSEPHEGVQVQEEVTPDSASRDTDLHTTGTASGGGYETHQHHRDSFSTKSYVQGN